MSIVTHEGRGPGAALRRIGRRLEVEVFGARRVRAVILGHQKSGTTAVAALTARAMGGDFSNDPLYRTDWGRGEVVQRVLNGSYDLQEVVRASRPLFCSKVVKDPDLTFRVQDCARTFPLAQLVLVVRDPRDTVRSIADRLSLTPEDLASPYAEGRNGSKHWQLILDGQLPVLEGSSVVERLAKRWKLAWDSCAGYSGVSTVLRYEDFLVDRASVIHDLVRGLGFRVRNDVTPFVDVSFQPPGRRSAHLSDRIGEENVRLIEQHCAAEIEALGYRL